MTFKLYDCDFSFTLDGVNYDFTHVDSVTIEDPERTRLTRGANAGNKLGLVYKEGLKEAKVVTVTLPEVPMELHNLLKDAYRLQKRLDFNCVARSDGSTKIAKNAVLGQQPQQLSLDDSPESLNTALIFETYDMEEVKKS